MGRRLFVGYRSDDQDRAATLIEDLAGFDNLPWMNKELTGGQDWWNEVLTQSRSCSRFIFSVGQN
jgi:hypothetical protein